MGGKQPIPTGDAVLLARQLNDLNAAPYDNAQADDHNETFRQLALKLAAAVMGGLKFTRPELDALNDALTYWIEENGSSHRARDREPYVFAQARIQHEIDYRDRRAAIEKDNKRMAKMEKTQ